MKKILLLPLMILGLTVSMGAQFNSIKNKVKEKTEDKKNEAQQQATQSVPSASANAAATKGDNGGSRGRGGKEVKGLTVDLDYASQPLPPAIAYYDLLSSTYMYYNPTNGNFYFDGMDIGFLPTKKANGEAMQYESYNTTNPPIWMDVVNVTTGNPVGTLYYHASPTVAPFSQMKFENRYAFPKSLTFTEEGNYECKFILGGKHFQTFPFSLKKMSSSDLYAPVKDMLFMDGPWRDAARIEIGTDGNLMFSFYHTHYTTKIQNAAQYETKKLMESTVKIKKGGSLVAVSSVDITGKKNEPRPFSSFNGKWNVEDFPLFKCPLDGNKTNFKVSHLADGTYDAELTIKDLETSKVENKVYTFTVSGGAILPSAMADRKKNTDISTIIEQGRKYIYLQKK
jgi:hypothetical protein